MDYLKTIFLYSKEHPLIFTQFYFWAFFAFVLFVYTWIANKQFARSAFLLAVSLFFYYKSSGFFFFLLVFSTVIDFYTGKWIYGASSQMKKKIILIFSIVVNLGLLSYFKYAYFFTEAYNNMVDSKYEVVNWIAKWTNDATGTHFEVNQILLPVGISFFTFQTMSYTIDIYRGLLKPVKSMVDFGFYVSFFPQLVAGPIVRASEFIPQIYKKFELSKYEFGLAIFMILKGLTKKIFIGDYIAVNFVDRIFTNPITYTGFENLMALIGYSLQVYVDFSGYTDIAIGVAMLMGFYLSDNFNSPYKALNTGEFWQRWHISLSTWLKDYLYYPLGGNRKASIGTYVGLFVVLAIIVLLSKNLYLIPIFGAVFVVIVSLSFLFTNVRKAVESNINRMLTMIIGGLWHGASWNFIYWGGLNGIGLVVYRFWKKSALTRIVFLLIINLTLIILYTSHGINFQLFKVLMLLLNIYWIVSYVTNIFSDKFNGKADRKWFLATPKIILTFSFITFTRVFFRGEDFLKAKQMLYQIGTAMKLSVVPEVIVAYKYVFLMMLFGFITHWLSYDFKNRWRDKFISSPMWVKITVSVVSVFIIYQSISAEMQAFIYFQF